MPIDYIYEREKKMDRDDSAREWFESRINDLILDYCARMNVRVTSFYRSEAKDRIIRALKNV